MTFQRMMDNLVRDLGATVVYLDDMLVASPDMVTHHRDLQLLFHRLQEHGLVLNLEKCSFGQSSVEFLGHTITAGGAVPVADSVAAIRDMPAPSSVKELQAFLGSINFYRRFLPGVARTLVPLTAVLKGGPKGVVKLLWTPDMRAAFVAAKQALCRAARLAFFDTSAAVSLMVDASDTHVGGVLQQRRQGAADWEPLGFFSTKLQPAQCKYSAFDRELWAMYTAVKYFRFMLEGRPFIIYTDHLPLTTALHSLAEPLLPRRQRQLSFIAEYTSDIRHVKGTSNVVADTLSRPFGGEVGDSSGAGPPAVSAAVPPAVSAVLSGSSSPVSNAGPPAVLGVAGPPAVLIASAVQPAARPVIDFAAIAAAQVGCADVAALSSPQSSLKVSSFEVGGHRLLCDTSTGSIRPLVPSSCRRLLFAAIHSIAHPGARASARLISAVLCGLA
jgi:hypothetical protein